MTKHAQTVLATVADGFRYAPEIVERSALPERRVAAILEKLLNADLVDRVGDQWRATPLGHHAVWEARGSRRMHAMQLQHLAVCNSDRLPQAINVDGRRQEWVGIGFIDQGPALGSEVVINRFCLNAHPLHGLCDRAYGHRGKHGCESPYAPRGKRYRKKARWTSSEGAEVSAEQAMDWNEQCRKGVYAGGMSDEQRKKFFAGR